ncbi:UbiX family flavin prenyltransferase [Bermanella marisrubri]|uniref:Flavin prenyltransferase UbiX n=1 Tax=Bermanella marisrubri TaxID=207949 RepID=Q1N0G0_9GAMM|nr:flavin prenyltransferase UbiX [Bermanella marisrubri]EAT11704.1 3-octaprenyl-4-hydroxybenzoate carboxy-lyase [Oceanobacter sp. RED65] [Bermanella marisrubri]QIZ83261.1 UbiX family flavin prenyltransferase [Bermanella marisrubri]
MQPSKDVSIKPITVAITGASGAPYTLRLLQCLVEAGKPIYVMISKAAQVVFATETDIKLPGTPDKMQAKLTEMFNAKPDQIQVFGREQWFAPVASGSGRNGPMVVCPCSTGTLSAIATGASNNLIERAADVAIKEQRKLILVPRETPFSPIHLENMLKLANLGVTIMPAAPGFYHNPQSIEDLVDFVVARILTHLEIDQDIMPLWGE